MRIAFQAHHVNCAFPKKISSGFELGSILGERGMKTIWTTTASDGITSPGLTVVLRFLRNGDIQWRRRCQWFVQRLASSSSPCPRFSWLVLAFLLCGGFRLAAQSTPIYPTWWANQGLLSGTSPSDFAAANQGQAINMAVGAVNELNADLAQFGGAGETLNELAVSLTGTTPQTSDYSAVNLGELKALVQPFYDRLLSVGYTLGPLASGTYPWATGGLTPNDFAVGNIGQLKYLFSFDVNYSSSSDQIPDWWVIRYFGQAAVSGTAIANGIVPWSGGQMTYLQAYQQGLNPVDFYNGQTPVLNIVSGNGQTGSPNAPNNFVPAPLIVSVTDTNGNPLYDAPVTFTVTSGSGNVQASSTNSAVSTLTALADSNGNAQAFFQLPPILSNTSTVTVTTGTANAATSGTFTEFSDDGTGTYASPFAPSNVVGAMNADGSETITWQNNDSSSPIYVYLQQPGGTWIVTGTLPAGTTSYTTSAPPAGPVQIGNKYSPGGSTGSAPGGAAPASNPFVSIPVLNYVAIDMSGTTATTDVSLVALDDTNNAAFAFPTGGGTNTQLNVYTWANGGATLNQTPQIVVQEEFAPGTGVSTGTVPVLLTYTPQFLLSTGRVFGYRMGADEAPGAGPNVLFDSGGFMATSGAVSKLDLPAPYGISSADSGIDYLMINGVNNTGECAGDSSFYYPSSPLANSDDYAPLGFIYNGAYTVFDDNGDDDPSNSQVTIQQGVDFYPTHLNDNNWATGYPFDGSDALVLTGTSTTPVLLDPMELPHAISDNNQVIGLTGNTGYLWTSGSGSLPISQLLPTQFQGEISDILPMAISSANAAGRVAILFNAQYQTNSNDATASGTFLLTIVGGANSNPIQLVSTPSNITTDFSSGFGSSAALNNQSLIADIANVAGSSTKHATLLVPIGINVVSSFNPNPGKPITSSSAVCVGEPITLSITSSTFVSSYNWHLPGAIKNFFVTSDSNPRIELSSTDFSAASPILYYPVVPQSGASSTIATSGTEVVSCDVTLVFGGTCSVTGSLALVAPAVTVTGSAPGPIYVSKNELSLATSGVLADGEDSALPDPPPSYGDGMDGDSQGVAPPSPFTSGSIAWLQVISDTVSAVSSGTYAYGNVTNYTNVNDHGFPYGNTFTPPWTIKPGSSSYHTADGPEYEADNPPMTELDRAFSGKMYYMWLSDAPNSIWVPLRAINWGFNGQIEWSGSTFILTGSSKAATTITVPSEEPDWTGRSASP